MVSSRKCGAAVLKRSCSVACWKLRYSKAALALDTALEEGGCMSPTEAMVLSPSATPGRLKAVEGREGQGSAGGMGMGMGMGSAYSPSSAAPLCMLREAVLTPEAYGSPAGMAAPITSVLSTPEAYASPGRAFVNTPSGGAAVGTPCAGGGEGGAAAVESPSSVDGGEGGAQRAHSPA